MMNRWSVSPKRDRIPPRRRVAVIGGAFLRNATDAGVVGDGQHDTRLRARRALRQEEERMLNWCFTMCLMAVVLGFLSVARADDSNRPNIIIVLVDDMGYSDVGCYGSEIDTPNIDQLAASGLRFTQFYNEGRCCPTRACLLTGRDPHQVGIGHMTEPPGTPLGIQGPYQGYLNDNCVTIAQVLRRGIPHTYDGQMARRHEPACILAVAPRIRSLLRLSERRVQLFQTGRRSWHYTR